MSKLTYLSISVLLQLVAMATLTTPSPVTQNEDEFADQLKTLNEASRDLQALVDELDVYQKLNDDSTRKLIDGLKDIAGVDEDDDDFETSDLADLVDELINESGDDDDDDVQDELKNLSDLGDVLQTVAPVKQDIAANKDDGDDDDDDVAKELTGLAARNESTASSRTELEDDDVETAASIDELIRDLMDAADNDETQAVDIVTPDQPDNDGNLVTEEVAVTDKDNNADYVLVTEIDTVTELIYDAVPDDGDYLDDDTVNDAVSVTLSSEESITPTSTDANDVEDDVDMTDRAAVPDVVTDWTEIVTDLTEIVTDGKEIVTDGTEIVTGVTEIVTDITEIVTEFETEATDVIAVDDIVDELRDLGRAGEQDEVDDVVAMTTQTSTLSEDDGLEDELEDLWNIPEDLRTIEGDILDDEEPTFVFTTPYPAILDSTETIDLGPDLTTITAKKNDKGCAEGHYACADGNQCVVQDTLCDLMMDCDDGSDENPDICKRDRVCPESYIRCGVSPQCVRDGDWCDGVFHCYNGADERTCMTCVGMKGDLKYLMMEDFCDGVQDCDDNHDETSERCGNPCPAGFSKCEDDHQCIKDHLVCDGFTNCRDRSDEGKHCARTQKECERFSMFACDGICMIKSALCDQTPDCRDGIDERGCTKDIFSCPDDFVLSRHTNNCVHRSIAEP